MSLLGLLVTSLFAAHAAAPPPIVNGDTTTDYPGVGAMTVYVLGTDYALCSGTVIDDQWVLTAAHCIEQAEYYRDSQGYSIEFMLTSDVADSSALSELVEVEEMFHHPDYDPSFLTYDVGLLKLAEPVSATPYAMSTDTPSLSWLNEDLRFVGFGVTAFNGTDAGVKRTADLPVMDVDPNIIWTYDDTGQNVCSGDSGGAAFRIIEDGSYELVGAISFVYPLYQGDDPCAEGGGGVARLDVARDWVDEVMASYGDGVPDDTDTTEDTGTTDTEDVISSTPSAGYLQTPEKGGCSSIGKLGGSGILAFLTLPLLTLFRRRVDTV